VLQFHLAVHLLTNYKELQMKTFKWVVEFEVTETWVEDGFNITQGRAIDMMANALPYASGAEFKATVLKAPDAKLIRKTQGYTD
jgi:hypothetical protein